jgi:hypothetical protein
MDSEPLEREAHVSTVKRKSDDSYTLIVDNIIQ